MFDPAGLSISAIEAGAPSRPCDLLGIQAVLREMEDFRIPVLVETTTLDITRGEPATSHVRAAFESRVHVISANKGPVAFAYRTLADEARRAGVSFLFEGAV